MPSFLVADSAILLELTFEVIWIGVREMVSVPRKKAKLSPNLLSYAGTSPKFPPTNETLPAKSQG
jgi:hypothetical protein